MFSKKFLNFKNLGLTVLITIAVATVFAPENLFQNQSVSTPNNSKNIVNSETTLSAPVKETDQEVSKKEEKSDDKKSEVAGTASQNPNNQPNAPKKKTTSKTSTQGQTPQQSEEEEPVVEQVTLKIDNGSANYSYKIDWIENMSVYDLLVKANSENNLSLKAEWYQAPLNSYYVTGLFGKECECWLYKVNDTCASTGISNYKINKDDIVTWSVNNIC